MNNSMGIDAGAPTIIYFRGGRGLLIYRIYRSTPYNLRGHPVTHKQGQVQHK